MSKKRKLLTFEESIVNDLGWSEEDWHYYWFCMYTNGVQCGMPVPDNIIKHYNQIPTKLINKFTLKGNKTKKQ